MKGATATQAKRTSKDNGHTPRPVIVPKPTAEVGPFGQVTIQPDKTYTSTEVVNNGVIQFVVADFPKDRPLCEIKLNIEFKKTAVLDGSGTIKIGS